MSFNKIFSSNNKILSFEFFPPKQIEELPTTFEKITELTAFKPNFMTVTYGAGGGTRTLTRQMVTFIQQQLHFPAVAHLTCVDHTVDDIDLILDQLKVAGISHILALRGDPQGGQGKFRAIPNGFSCARDLVAHIKRRGDFSIAVGGYPEVHPDATSPEADIRYLKEKVDAGAELIMTQLFFSASMYFDFVETARKIGINVPILPGIIPLTSLAQARRFTSRCSASIPNNLEKNLEKYADNPTEELQYCTDYFIQLSTELLEHDAPGIHFFTLNKSTQANSIIGTLKKEGLL